MSKDIILQVKNLVTEFHTESGPVRVDDDVSFEVKKGSIFGIVGESGCGKSVTALTIMRLLPQPTGRIISGQILFDGLDLAQLPSEQMPKLRGKRIAMIFQEPMTALNPVHRIGRQLEEVFQLHFTEMTNGQINTEAIHLLQKVGIPDPKKRMHEYPHQISGGMRQRVMIAMALAGKPDILIADEPTTALDVTIQAQILELMLKLQQETGMAIIFITHDLGVIAQISDDVLVMYAGKVMESAPVEELFKNPMHPYTKGLLASIPRLDSKPKEKLNVIKGRVPNLQDFPDGCRFRNRCPDKGVDCEKEMATMVQVAKDHYVNCIL